MIQVKRVSCIAWMDGLPEENLVIFIPTCSRSQCSVESVVSLGHARVRYPL